MVKCSQCGSDTGDIAEQAEHLKAHKHLPAHSQPEHNTYTAYQDKRMTDIEKRLDKLEGK